MKCPHDQFLGAAATVAVILVGCGKPGTAPTAPVSGTLLYKGAPATSVRVIFTPKSGRPGFGHTDESGRFVLTTFTEGDGAVPGPHTVTITDRLRNWIPESGQTKPPPGRFPEAYSRPADTPLKVEVTADEDNVYNFDMVDQP